MITSVAKRLSWEKEIVVRNEPCGLVSGNVQVERRDVGGAGLEHLRAGYVRKGGHAPVDLLVDLYEKVAYVRAVTEGEPDGSATVLRLTDYILQPVDLDELLAKGSQDGLVHLPGGEVGRRGLDRYVGDINLGNQGDRKKAHADEPQDDDNEGYHRHCHWSVYEGFEHLLPFEGHLGVVRQVEVA